MPDRDQIITPASNIREVVARYPGIERVFDRHGLAGCGGPDGPDEPIGLFARVHHVDPFALVAELNAYVKTGSAPVPMAAAPPTQRETYRLFVGTALIIAVTVGFLLAFSMPLTQALHIDWGKWWMPHVQAHGHAQLAGFAALFTMGIAFHVVPRFKQTTLSFQRLVMPCYVLAVLGVLLRLLGQPAAANPAFAVLFGLSGLLELAAAALFALIIISTVRAGRQRELFDPFLVIGAAGFVLQGAANAAISIDAARLGETVVPLGRDNAQIQLMVYGALLPFIFGVSLRTLPAFLGVTPPPRELLLGVLAVHITALAEIQAVGWVQAAGGWSPPGYLLNAGPLALGLALVAFALSINPLDAEPPDGAHHVAEGYLRSAYVWLGLAGALQAWFAGRAWMRGDYVSLAQIDSARHAVALGFITMMIVGMATRVLPVFAGRRLHSGTMAVGALYALNIAGALRVVGGLMADSSYVNDRYWFMAAAGALGLFAVALFAYNLYRTVTSRPPGATAALRATSTA